MKRFVVFFLCFIPSSAIAQQFVFRGNFVDTYMAEKGFLYKVPYDTKLNCEQGLCSYSKSVRIYVFKNKEAIKRFWSTDYCDVMFDEPETLLACGNDNYIAYYDETNQLLSRDHVCHTVGDAPLQRDSHYRLLKDELTQRLRREENAGSGKVQVTGY